ncbi:MAG: transposase [Ktedonobacteraceae bacterium]
MPGWVYDRGVYHKAEELADVNPSHIATLDLGVNTLAAVTSSKQGFKSLLVNGHPLKSVKQHSNKQRARHQKRLAKANRFTSRQPNRITTKCNRRVNAYLHTASCRIIDPLVQAGIGTIAVGKNPLLTSYSDTVGRRRLQCKQAHSEVSSVTRSIHRHFFIRLR